MIPPTIRPATRRAERVDEPFDDRPDAPDRLAGRMRDQSWSVCGTTVEDVQLLEAVEEDSAADPQHRRGADRRQSAEQRRDDVDQRVADRSRRCGCCRSARCRPMSSSFTISATTP